MSDNEMLKLADELGAFAERSHSESKHPISAADMALIIKASDTLRAAAASAEPVATNDKIQESAFRAGLKLGWNLAGDEDAFKRAMDAHSWNELTATGLYTHPAPDAEIVAALPTREEIGKAIGIAMYGESTFRSPDLNGWNLSDVLPAADAVIALTEAKGGSRT